MKIKHLNQICIGPTISDTEIQKVRSILKDDKNIKNRVEIHKLLSGETRYKLIKLLNELNELCVCDMAEILNTTISAVSHQLKLLRKAEVVTTRRESQTIYYSLKDKEVAKIL